MQITPLSAAKADPVLWARAQELEATFLAEMLKQGGLGASEGLGSGGIGEEQFTSFLREAQAKLMVQKGGIGLAEQIFRSLAEKGAA